MTKYKLFQEAKEVNRLLSYLIQLNFHLDEKTLLDLQYFLLKKSDEKRLVSFFQITKGLHMSEADQNFCLKVINNGRYPAIKKVLCELYCIYLAYTYLLEEKPLKYLYDWMLYPSKINKKVRRNKKANKRYEITKYIVAHPTWNSEQIAIGISINRGNTYDNGIRLITSEDIRSTWFHVIHHLTSVDDELIKIWGYLLATICFGRVHWKYLSKLLEILSPYEKRFIQK